MNAKSYLWQSTRANSQPDPIVSDYIREKDLGADQALIPYEIAASKAHAQMLGACRLISEENAEKLCRVLNELLDMYQSGNFTIGNEFEDIHSAVECFLVEKLGDVGKQLHLGRSRNDQVLVAVRLYMKDHIHKTLRSIGSTEKSLLEFAKKYEFVPMPGFTHMQYAMPSSVGQWAGAFVESLLADVQHLQGILRVIDCNPLGSAAGFGTNVPIDREFTTHQLGFSRIQTNPVFCQNSRGKFESLVLHGLLQTMMTLGRLANDVVIFHSQPFRFFKMHESLMTGSSIMPQKKNPDVMEVMRAHVSTLHSLTLECQIASMNLISGYNKDLKITKKNVMRGFEILLTSLALTQRVFSDMQVNESVLRDCFDDPSIFAANVANDLVMKHGIPFRDAYRQVKDDPALLKKMRLDDVLKNSTHLGATGNLSLQTYETPIEALLQ